MKYATLAFGLMAVLAVLGSVAAQSVNPCVFSVNGKYFDFRNSTDTPSGSSNGRSSLVNSCKPVTTSSTICNGALQCNMNSAGAAENAISKNISSVTHSGSNLVVVYQAGDYCPNQVPPVYRQATITYTCGTTDTGPSFISEVGCKYTYTWTTPYACPLDSDPSGGGGGGGGGGGSSGGIGGGDIFLIIFFCGGFLYVVIGMAYSYKVKEARGIEMIPNIDFWRGLPSLLKDGAVFAYSKVKSLFVRE